MNEQYCRTLGAMMEAIRYIALEHGDAEVMITILPSGNMSASVRNETGEPSRTFYMTHGVEICEANCHSFDDGINFYWDDDDPAD